MSTPDSDSNKIALKEEKSSENRCIFCYFETKTKSLKKHYKRAHFIDDLTVCPFCNEKNPNLATHVPLKHGKEPVIQCRKCNFLALTQKLLNKHEIEKHNDQKVAKLCCDVNNCTFITKNKSLLQQHKRQVHGKVTFECLSCEYTSTNKRYLELHTNRIHTKNRQFKCDFCEFSTTEKSTLSRHIIRKHKNTQKDFKTCSFCDYFTVAISDLKRHVQRNHECQFCDYKVNSKEMLKEHLKNNHPLSKKRLMRKKSEEFKRIQCKYCNYKTSFKNDLEKHYKTKHDVLKITLRQCINNNHYKTCDKTQGNSLKQVKSLKNDLNNRNNTKYDSKPLTKQSQSCKRHVNSQNSAKNDLITTVQPTSNLNNLYTTKEVVVTTPQPSSVKIELDDLKTNKFNPTTGHLNNTRDLNAPSQKFVPQNNILNPKTSKKMEICVKNDTFLNTKEFNLKYLCDFCDYKTKYTTLIEMHYLNFHSKKVEVEINSNLVNFCENGNEVKPEVKNLIKHEVKQEPLEFFHDTFDIKTEAEF